MAHHEGYGSGHDMALDKILAAGPPVVTPQSGQFMRQATQFYKSNIGVAFISGTGLGILLVLLKPDYVLKRRTDRCHGLPHVNYDWILVLSIVCSACVFFIPHIIELSH